jgi:cysteine sulfinate desulfinase/cysteine desulfurase-like protein
MMNYRKLLAHIITPKMEHPTTGKDVCVPDKVIMSTHRTFYFAQVLFSRIFMMNYRKLLAHIITPKMEHPTTGKDVCVPEKVRMSAHRTFYFREYL